MNPNSSRSHVILTLDLEVVQSNKIGTLFSSTNTTIILADLAGSECLEKTKTKGKNTKEGGSINKSLLSLSNVIAKLARKDDYIGFRESKLTRIMQNVLTNPSMTSVICTVCPLKSFESESMNTLRFAICAGGVVKRCTPQQVEDNSKMDNRVAKEMFQEIQTLEEHLENSKQEISQLKQECEVLKQKLEASENNLRLVNNEKNSILKELSKAEEMTSRSMMDNSKLQGLLEELEHKITLQKEIQFKQMFEQQSILIRNLEEENAKLQYEKEQAPQIERKKVKFGVLPCLKKGQNQMASSSFFKSAEKVDPEQSEHKEQSDPEDNRSYERQVVDLVLYEKAKQETEVHKQESREKQKEIIRLEKVIHSLNQEVQQLRKAISQNQEFMEERRRLKPTINPGSLFDRNGDKIFSKIIGSPTKSDYKRQLQYFEQKNARRDKTLDQLLKCEEISKLGNYSYKT